MLLSLSSSFLWQILEKLSHHRCGIPVEFDGVLEHLLVRIEFREMLADVPCPLASVHSLDSYMSVFLK